MFAASIDQLAELRLFSRNGLALFIRDSLALFPFYFFVGLTPSLVNIPLMRKPLAEGRGLPL